MLRAVLTPISLSSIYMYVKADLHYAEVQAVWIIPDVNYDISLGGK